MRIAIPMLSAPGHKFSRWAVVRSFVPVGGGAAVADCVCDCGTTRRVPMNSLRTGRSRSCGCYMREASRRDLTARVTTHGLSKDPAYKSWKSAKGRCFNANNPKFPEYGGRGITMCAEWVNNFPLFLGHVGPRPSRAHSIDRIDNDGDYEPGNVRWATATEQSRNRRHRRWGRKPLEARA